MPRQKATTIFVTLVTHYTNAQTQNQLDITIEPRRPSLFSTMAIVFIILWSDGHYV
jgi:hypothetical protein